MLEACGVNGKALSYASPSLMQDREVVLKAVKQYGSALWYASEDLQKDRDLVLETVCSAQEIFIGLSH